jgi:hypothetical protein
MKNVLQAFASFLLLFLAAKDTIAQKLPMAAISVNASTSGAGMGFNASLSKKWAVTGELFYLRFKGQYDFLIEKFPVTVNPNTQMGTVTLRADHYPFAGRRRVDSLQQRRGLRLSAGIGWRSNPSFGGQFRLAETYAIGSFQLTDLQRGYVQTIITMSALQPYAGIGYDLRMSRYMSLGVDAGTFYIGKPRVQMIATGLLSDIARNERQLEKNLSPFRWYPHVGIKFNYCLQGIH